MKIFHSFSKSLEVLKMIFESNFWAIVCLKNLNFIP